MTNAPSRDELIEQLIITRVAGEVATPRDNNLDHYRSLAVGDPHYLLGLTFEGAWTYKDVLALMAKSAGVVADPDHRYGQDTIDPERTVAATEAMGDRIAAALSRPGTRFALATGHPTGIMVIHLALAGFLAARGATVISPAEGWTYQPGSFGRRRRIRYVGDVALLDDGGALVHTHDSTPMRAMLAEERPDFVIADHGWAGAAGEAGIETVAFADSNDPGLFVGEAEGKIAVTVPLDDNVLPRYYGPLTRYLLAWITAGL
ncbi:putative phosphatase [Acrocarpospora phusangensis]|uniref:Phosphatase n=1 Tax=Acrocarpospora phusangensis TaxID=1070424 RepID=A0A919Q939_9ACTN|nr:phosphatase [Acrocarpospora phusangensis]GIH22450.1 putative phosphatase [Acrocarpospora phusangensis]